MEESIIDNIIKQLDEKLSQLNLQNQSILIHAETAAGICQLVPDDEKLNPPFRFQALTESQEYSLTFHHQTPLGLLISEGSLQA